MKITVTLLCLLLIASYDSVSQPAKYIRIDSVSQYTMPNTEVRFLSSETNNIDYKLYVSYPENYNQDSSERYPVLYLLDADYSFAIAKNIIDHLAQRNHIQEIIIVGIAYAGPNQYRLHRTRDYTPTNSNEPVSFPEIQQQYSGGGLQFSTFIQNELIPYVDSQFRTTDFRVLTGHSYGGLFTSWMLLNNPSLFQGYIAVSPSLWYDNHLLFHSEETLSSYSGKKIKVYFSVGDREINQHWNMPADLQRFTEKLRNMELDQLEIKQDMGSDETHNSIFPSALSNGLRFVFDGR
jgi:predicted alpha/beta superfamily hydrolase